MAAFRGRPFSVLSSADFTAVARAGSIALAAIQLIEVRARHDHVAGHVIFGCCCALNTSTTRLAASISFCDRCSLGSSLKMSMPREISDP